MLDFHCALLRGHFRGRETYFLTMRILNQVSRSARMVLSRL